MSMCKIGCKHFNPGAEALKHQGVERNPGYQFNRNVPYPACLHPANQTDGQVVACGYAESHDGCILYEPSLPKVMARFSFEASSPIPTPTDMRRRPQRHNHDRDTESFYPYEGHVIRVISMDGITRYAIDISRDIAVPEEYRLGNYDDDIVSGIFTYDRVMSWSAHDMEEEELLKVANENIESACRRRFREVRNIQILKLPTARSSPLSYLQAVVSS